jgi:PAS domain S-box-containing protein
MKPTPEGTRTGALVSTAGGAPDWESLYKGLFEFPAVSLWEEDASRVKSYLDDIKSRRGDIRTYLDYHPEEVAKCTSMIRVKAVNRPTVDLYEAPDAAALLSDLDKILCEESYDVLKRVLVAIAEGQTRFEANAFNRTLTGRKKHIRMKWWVAPGCENTYERVWVEMTDLTEHEFIERELDDKAKQYRMLAEYVNDVIWTMDMSLHFTSVSPSVERTLGYKVEEILDMPFQKLLTPASLEVAMAAVTHELSPEALRKGDPRRSRVLELEFIRKDGSRMWGELNISFVLDEENLPSGVIGVVRDVTERYVAMAKLERSGEAQQVINDLLELSLEDISTDEMMQRMIDRIVDVSWFPSGTKGVIMLVDDGSGCLVMKCESGLAGEPFKVCARRKLGECVCGKAAASRQPASRSGDSARPDSRCELAPGYGQYSVPFPSSGDLLGVLNLFVSGQHGMDQGEMDFLSAIGRVLAGALERRRAYESLRKSEASYRSVFDKAGEGIFIHDPVSGRIEDVNHSTCQLFGFDRERLLTMDVGSISSGKTPYSQTDALELIRKAAAEGPQLFEWHSRNGSGHLFWVEVSLALMRIGGAEKVVAFVRDIDARKKAEQKALGLTRFLESILDRTHLWISAVDTDGNVIMWNKAAERMSGYAREEMIGNSSIWKSICPDDEFRKACLEKGGGGSGEIPEVLEHRTRMIGKNGESRLMFWHSYPLEDEHGKTCCCVHMGLDVTDRTEEGRPGLDIRNRIAAALEREPL